MIGSQCRYGTARRVACKRRGLLHPDETSRDVHLVVLDHNPPAVRVVLPFPVHFPIDHVTPGRQEMFEEVFKPFHVVVELLCPVPDDGRAEFVRYPLTPEARLTFGRFVVIENGRVAALPKLSTSANKVSS